MAEKNTADLRVVKSLRAIKQAYMKLVLKEDDYSRIRVSDIASEALVNRKTVYRHFLTIDDIGYSIMDDLAKSLSERLSTLEPQDLAGGVRMFYVYLNTDESTYQKMFFDEEYQRFFCRFEKDALNDGFFKNFYKKMQEPELGPGYFSAMTFIFLRWRKQKAEERTDLDTLAEQTAQLLLNGIKS